MMIRIVAITRKNIMYTGLRKTGPSSWFKISNAFWNISVIGTP